MRDKVLLIVPPVRLSEPPHRFPLGLGYVAASLVKAGLDTSVLDLNISRPTSAEEERKISEAMRGVKVVAMGGMITMANTIIRIADIVKRRSPEAAVIVGGPISSHQQKLILERSEIDVLVIGEGEYTAPKLAKALIENTAIKGIAGLVYLEDGVLVRTDGPCRIDDLDSLPMPGYHLFPFDSYVRNRGGIRTTDIIGSRGCPYNCSFCHRNFGRKVRFRSVDSILEGIRFLKVFYGIKHIHLEDELFIQREDFIESFCRGVERIGGLTWSACARVNTLSLDVAKRMKASGCISTMIGIESFNQRLLFEMNKKTTIEQIDDACGWLNRCGIEIRPGLIIGMPGESRESIRDTIEGCKRHRIRIDEWSYAFATPYPGTELYERALLSKRIEDEWSYVQKLCEVGDTRRLAANLTDFSDEELIRLRDEAIAEVSGEVEPGRGSARRIRYGGFGIKRKARSLLGKIAARMNREASPFAGVREEHFAKDLARGRARELLGKAVQMVEIEVFSYCNRRCLHCPNSTHDRLSKNVYMEAALYRRILKELRRVRYRGMVSFSRYNEPLADPIIYERLEEARKMLPGAVLHLNSNGDYIKEETFGRLYDAGLRSLNIQVYLRDGEEYTDEIVAERLARRLKRYRLPSEYRFSKPGGWLEYELFYLDMRIRLYARNFLENGSNRGGILPRYDKKGLRVSPCLVPFYNIYIDYNGKVVPCCNIRSDVPGHYAYVLGDLTEKGATLYGIFGGKKATAWRGGLVGFGEKGPPCDRCRFMEVEQSASNVKRARAIRRILEKGR